MAKKKTSVRDRKPMGAKGIKNAQALLEQIGKHEKDGFFMVVEIQDLGEGTLLAGGIGKITNANNAVIISTILETLKVTPMELMKYLVRKQLEEDLDD